MVPFYWCGYSYTSHYIDLGKQDHEFLCQVRGRVEGEPIPLYVNAQLESCLEVNRVLFYSKSGTHVVHNLTFLFQDGMEDHIYLVTQVKDEGRLNKIGEAKLLLRSEKSRRERIEQDRLGLFEVKLRPDRPRIHQVTYIRQQQIKHREPGPFLGGVDPEAW